MKTVVLEKSIFYTQRTNEFAKQLFKIDENGGSSELL